MSAPTFPTMRYHPQEPPRLLEGAEALAALGPEWRDTPYTAEEKRQYQDQQVPPAAAEEPRPQPRKR